MNLPQAGETPPGNEILWRLSLPAEVRLKSVYLIATRDLSNLWLQFFLSQNQGFMRLFEKTVLK